MISDTFSAHEARQQDKLRKHMAERDMRALDNPACDRCTDPELVEVFDPPGSQSLGLVR
jgi:hypothetical protein